MSYPPPQGPPPGQGHYGQQAGYPPQQGGYPPPQGYGQQPGYPPPQGQYPPQQQPYGQPGSYPPPQGPPPPQQQYGQPSYPPPGQFGAPQPIYGTHPGQQPPQQPYGAPPGQYAHPSGFAPPPQHAGPPTPASPGYIDDARYLPPTDMNGPAADLRDAMKGFGTNEKKLIATLTAVPDAPHMDKLRRTYDDRFRRSLIKDIQSETSSKFEDALCAVARGPLLQDAYAVNKAVARMGTDEELLDDILIGRSNADMNAIQQKYRQIYGKDMVKEVLDDLSGDTKTMYQYILAGQRAEESAPCIPHEIEQKVDRLQDATKGRSIGTNEEVVCQILAYASDGQIRAMAHRYNDKYKTTLDAVIKSQTSIQKHMQHALLLMIARAVDRVKSDADDLAASMKGAGTKNDLLINGLVRIHWNREHLRQVKVAFTRFHHKKGLAARIEDDISRGHYRDIMVALAGQG